MAFKKVNQLSLESGVFKYIEEIELGTGFHSTNSTSEELSCNENTECEKLDSIMQLINTEYEKGSQLISSFQKDMNAIITHTNHIDHKPNRLRKSSDILNAANAFYTSVVAIDTYRRTNKLKEHVNTIKSHVTKDHNNLLETVTFLSKLQDYNIENHMLLSNEMNPYILFIIFMLE